MKIFLSYASEDRALAEDIQLALSGAGHEVFFDRQSLPASGDYHQRIRAAVNGADLFVFLISPDSVDAGGYALTEMGYARERWAHPKGKVLPVMGRPTPFTEIPAYLKSVTILEPRGNTAAEVVLAVEKVATPVVFEAGAKPASTSADAARGTLKIGLIAAAALLVAAAAVYFKPWVTPDAEVAKLERLIDAANIACVSNSEVQNAAKVGTDLNLLLDKVKGEGSISEYRKKFVGANTALPAELQSLENAAIRGCMANFMPGIFAAMGITVVAPKAAEAELPALVQLRFTLDEPANDKLALDDTLRVNLQAPLIVDGERLAQQAPGYYAHNTAYPREDQKVLGTVVREVKESNVHAMPVPANFCLRRPTPLPTTKDPHHAHLDCTAAGTCKMHFPSPAWLEMCPVEAPKTSLGFSLFPLAHAAEPRRWAVPSAKTLRAHQGQRKGVGYTLIDIETDVFMNAAVRGVEVEVLVNGTPVMEDGLLPAQRPVPNNPTQPFRHAYALESLDFQGARAGCEAITLTLRARGEKGPLPGATHTATLAYVALRDKPTTTVPFGTGRLTWTANYVVPDAEWSHEAFIASMTYLQSAGEAAAEATRKQAVDLKQRFDKLGVLYGGQPLVAVIRPPLTLSADKLAYGITAGVVQPSGQVRFTFSYAEAKAIAQAMLDWRAAHANARGIINAASYIYRVAGNAEREKTTTPSGVCRHVTS